MVGGVERRAERGIDLGRGVSGRGGKSAMEEVEGRGAEDKDEVEEVEGRGAEDKDEVEEVPPLVGHCV